MRTSIRVRRPARSAAITRLRQRRPHDALTTAVNPAAVRFVIDAADAGTRERLLTAAQRSVGNAALGRVIATIVPGATGTGGGGVNLHGQTTADFDGGTSSWSPRSIRRAADCTDCPAEDPCIRATGTFTIRYHADVTIRMPDMPSGLTACQQRRVHAFLRDVLGPHERDHARRFHTYDGSVRHAIDFTGCGRSALQAHLQDIHDAEEAKRQADANALSAAIDPFVREVDLDCN